MSYELINKLFADHFPLSQKVNNIVREETLKPKVEEPKTEKPEIKIELDEENAKTLHY